MRLPMHCTSSEGSCTLRILCVQPRPCLRSRGKVVDEFERRGPRKELSVGEAARRSGVAVSTLHYYESKGLDPKLPDPREPAALSARSTETYRYHQGSAEGRHSSRGHSESPGVASRGSRADTCGLAQAVNGLEIGIGQPHSETYPAARSA